MKYLGRIKKTELHKFIQVTNSNLFCYLPSTHSGCVEVYKTKHTLESQKGDVLSHSPNDAIDILEGKSISHYSGKKDGKTIFEDVSWDMIYTCS